MLGPAAFVVLYIYCMCITSINSSTELDFQCSLSSLFSMACFREDPALNVSTSWSLFLSVAAALQKKHTFLLNGVD